MAVSGNKRFQKKITCLLIAACSAWGSLPALGDVEEITIVGIREVRTSKGATGLTLTTFETPQSLTVIDGELLDAFQLNDINRALKLVTGVNVEQAETDRTYYNARGFDITSMHVDGVGIPFDGLVQGDLDTAIYEKVEVVRGANGLITGIGNPSGTINYIRKRPTNDFKLSGELAAGSWNQKRAELDLSSPITQSGSWAARGVVAIEDKESWLDLYQHQRQTAYGIVDGQLSPNITLALGHTYQSSRSEGVLWGALPLVYSDGSQADFDISTTTSMDWTYWDATTNTSFVEMGANLPGDWQWLSTLTYTDYDEPSEIFYVYLSPGLDRETGLGVQAWPGKFHSTSQSLQWDNSLSGKFEWGGLEHELVLGASLADQDLKSLDYAALTGFVPMPAYPGWKGNEVPRPTWGDAEVAAKSNIKLNRLFGAARFALSDNFHTIIGFNSVSYKREGYSWDVSTDTDDQKTSPYAGFTWTLMPSLNLYASYSDIYQPQYELNDDQQPLGPAQGKSYEAGIKKEWLNGALLTSFALFQVEQSNLAEFAQYTDCDDIPDEDTSDDFNCAEYRAITAESEGFEAEVFGKLTENLSIQAGYTQLSLKDPEGNDSRTFIPRKTLKMILRWNPTAVEKLDLGISSRWQSDIHNNGIEQSAFSVFGLFASYEVARNMRVAVNLDNVGDEKYLNSLQWDQAFYGAPRNFSVNLDWKL